MKMISENRDSASTAWKNMGGGKPSFNPNIHYPQSPLPPDHVLHGHFPHPASSSPTSALGTFPVHHGIVPQQQQPQQQLPTSPMSPSRFHGEGVVGGIDGNRARAYSTGAFPMTYGAGKPLLSPVQHKPTTSPPGSPPYGGQRRSALSPLANPNAIWNFGHHPAPHQHHQYHHAHYRRQSCPTLNVGGGGLLGVENFPTLPQLGNSFDPTAGQLSGLGRVPHPISASEAKKCQEVAMQAERVRAKNLEKDELHMTADQLRTVLKQERHRMSRFVGELAKLKNNAVKCQAEAEILEEGRINGLMRRVEALQKEKGKIIVELEQEEEMLTNNLQKKLDGVRKEKERLEKQIEQEHRHVTNLQENNKSLKQQQQQQHQGTKKKKQPRMEMDPLTESSDEENEKEDDDDDVEKVVHYGSERVVSEEDDENNCNGSVATTET